MLFVITGGICLAVILYASYAIIAVIALLLLFAAAKAYFSVKKWFNDIDN